MKNRRIVVASGVTLLLLCSWPALLPGQDDVDDESSLGAPDLFTYSDEGAEARDSVDSTLNSATGLAQRGIVFEADMSIHAIRIGAGACSAAPPYRTATRTRSAGSPA